MKRRVNTIKPFHATANRLLRMDIKTVADINRFYIGVNELASEIVLNSILISELDSVKYGDNQKLIKAITYILGYGQVIGRYSDLFTAEEVKLNAFLKKNPQFKRGVAIVKKEATVYFNTLAKRVEELERQNKEMKEEMVKKMEELRKDIQVLRDIKMLSATEEISIGPLKYKEYSVSCHGVPMHLPPQEARLCRLFMEKSRDNDSVLSDNSIEEIVSSKTLISNKNMQKLVSKLRRALKKADKRLDIKRVNKQGYIFIAKNIR